MFQSIQLIPVVLLMALSVNPAVARQLETIQPPSATQAESNFLPSPSTAHTHNPPRYVSAPVQHYRIKDITTIEGERENSVDGIGLVVGLSQTGGRATQTQLMAQNYYQRKGLAVIDPETRAMSAVIVTGTIHAYAKKGERIQVNVAVADDSTSLRGGTLVRTPLKGLDGQVYAIASGPIVGGGVAAGGDAASVQRDHPTVGVCSAIIEREICSDQIIVRNNTIQLILRNKEYSTAVSIANILNTAFPDVARAMDVGTVAVYIPRTFQNKIPDFISVIHQLSVPVDARARVIINQKTGTIIMGQNVRISPVVFSKGSLVIATSETPVASQPEPFSEGETVVLPRTDVDISESGGPYSNLGGGTTVGELGRALNELGFTPNMLIEMFTSLEKMGALQAELVIE